MPSSRRSVLTALAAALAGCSAAPDGGDETTSTLSPAPVDTRTETPHATSAHQTAEHSRTLELRAFEREVEAVGRGVLRGDDHLRPFEAELISDAVAGGEATFATYSFTPLQERVYVERDGYYRLDRSVESTRTITVHRFRLDAVTACGDPAPTERDIVAFADLSPADQHAFVSSNERHMDERGCFASGYQYHYASESDAAASTLVNDSPTYVRYEGEVYLVEFSRTHSAEETTFRFDATHAGESLTDYAEAIAPEVAWTVAADSLSANERELLAHLVEEGHYRTEDPIPEPVDSVAALIRQNTYTVRRSPAYYIRYEGRYYAVRISGAVS